MKLTSVVVSLFVASAEADAGINLVRGNIKAESAIGQNLLSKARQLENNNNYY